MECSGFTSTVRFQPWEQTACTSEGRTPISASCSEAFRQCSWGYFSKSTSWRSPTIPQNSSSPFQDSRKEGCCGEARRAPRRRRCSKAKSLHWRTRAFGFRCRLASRRRSSSPGAAKASFQRRLMKGAARSTLLATRSLGRWMMRYSRRGVRVAMGARASTRSATMSTRDRAFPMAVPAFSCGWEARGSWGAGLRSRQARWGRGDYSWRRMVYSPGRASRPPRSSWRNSEFPENSSTFPGGRVISAVVL